MAYFAAIAFLLALSTPIYADGSLEGLVYAPGHASADYYTYPRYAFEYAVRDPYTGDNKAQWEKRDGDLVIGAYALVEPDGSLRVVEYRADDKTGFNAVVKRIGPNIHPMATPIYKASIPSLGYKSYLPHLIGPVAGLEKLASAPLYNGGYSGNTISSGLLYKSLSPAIIKEVAPISPLGKIIEAKVSIPAPLYNAQIIPEPIYKRPIIPEPIYKRPIIPEPIYKGPIIIPEPIYKRPIIPEPMYKGPIIIPELIYKRPIIPEPMYKGPIIIPEPIYKRPIIPQPIYKGPIIPEPIYKGPIIPQPIYKGPTIPQPIYKGPIIPEPIYKAPILPTYKVPNPQIPVYKSPMVQKSYHPAILPLSILKQAPFLREPIYSSRLKNLDPNAYQGIDNNILNNVLLNYKTLIGNNAPLGYKENLDYNAPLIYKGYTGSGWGYGY